MGEVVYTRREWKGITDGLSMDRNSSNVSGGRGAGDRGVAGGDLWTYSSWIRSTASAGGLASGSAGDKDEMSFMDATDGGDLMEEGVGRL